jgi:hypothetical protein
VEPFEEPLGLAAEPGGLWATRRCKIKALGHLLVIIPADPY